MPPFDRERERERADVQCSYFRRTSRNRNAVRLPIGPWEKLELFRLYREGNKYR